MSEPAGQTEICNRCGQEKPWTDVWEINLENVCTDCMTEEEKEN